MADKDRKNARAPESVGIGAGNAVTGAAGGANGDFYGANRVLYGANGAYPLQAGGMTGVGAAGGANGDFYGANRVLYGANEAYPLQAGGLTGAGAVNGANGQNVNGAGIVGAGVPQSGNNLSYGANGAYPLQAGGQAGVGQSGGSARAGFGNGGMPGAAPTYAEMASAGSGSGGFIGGIGNAGAGGNAGGGGLPTFGSLIGADGTSGGNAGGFIGGIGNAGAGGGLNADGTSYGANGAYQGTAETVGDGMSGGNAGGGNLSLRGEPGVTPGTFGGQADANGKNTHPHPEWADSGALMAPVSKEGSPAVKGFDTAPPDPVANPNDFGISEKDVMTATADPRNKLGGNPPHGGTTGNGNAGADSAAGGNAAAGSTGEGGTSASSSDGQPMSYEEYLESQRNSYGEDRDAMGKFYDDRLAKATERIDTEKKAAEDFAKRQQELSYAAAVARREREEKETAIARERSVVDARSSLEENRATYGRNAEQLSEMGLSGGGYSDYLNAAAYAASRGEIQSANAAAETRNRQAADAESEAKASADSSYENAMFEAGRTARSDLADAEDEAAKGKFGADLTYRDNIRGLESDEQKWRETEREKEEARQKEEEEKAEQKEENARNAFVNLLSGANSGTYNESQLRQLAMEYGLNEMQTGQLVTAAAEYQKKLAASANASLDETVTGNIESLIDAGTIGKEEGAKRLMNGYREVFDAWDGDTESLLSEIKNVDSAWAKGYISESEYNELKNTYNEQIKYSADTIFNDCITREAAEITYNRLLKNGWLSEENKTRLEAKINDLFKEAKTNWVYNKNASVGELEQKGNNFRLVLSENGNESTQYRVESGGKYEGEDYPVIKNAAAHLKDDEVFAYGDKVFMKKNGILYLIVARNTKKSKADYAALCEKLGIN